MFLELSQPPEVDGAMPPAEAARAAALAAISVEEELLLANLVARLQRVVTEPGSGDRAFLRDIRGKAPRVLSAAQMARVRRIAWRYRFQLPPLLRPAVNPDGAA